VSCVELDMNESYGNSAKRPSRCLLGYDHRPSCGGVVNKPFLRNAIAHPTLQRQLVRGLALASLFYARQRHVRKH